MQWRTVTSEAGHAIGMPKLDMQFICNTLGVEPKIVWDSKTKTNCPKIIVLSKEKANTQKFVGHAKHDLHALTARHCHTIS